MTELQLPPFSGWSIPDATLATLSAIISDRVVDLIVEAGSGRSTIVLADALRQTGHGRIVALEHLPEFCERWREYLRRNDLEAFAEIRYAPLELHGEGGCLSPTWYARSAWQDLRDIDLLLVDGPPGHSSPFARDPAVPLLRGRLAADALIVLDDSQRAEEQKTLEHWALAWQNHIPRNRGRLTLGGYSAHYAPGMLE